MDGTQLSGEALVAVLAEVRLDRLDRDRRLEVALAWGRLESWCAARKAEALAVFAATAPEDDPTSGRTPSQVAEEYACAAHLSRGQAEFDIQEATTLAGPLRTVRDALADGEISVRHVRKIDGVLSPLIGAINDPHADPEQVETWREKLRQLTYRLAAYARDHTPAETRTRGLAWVARQVPEVIDTDRRRAVHARAVEHVPGDNGLGTLFITGPLDQTSLAWKAIDIAARASATAASGPPTADAASPDQRTLDQRRADLALGLLCGTLDPGALTASPAAGTSSLSRPTTPPAPAPAPDSSYDRKQPSVQVLLTLDFDTFMGCVDNPAMLDGFPITATYARELLADAEFRRMILHPLTGELLDRSSTTYRPTKSLAEFVRSRDPVCIVPGCHQPATRCDLDHREPFDQEHPERGGATTRDELAPLCRAHHLLKTHHGFRLEPRLPRAEEWGRDESELRDGTTERTTAGGTTADGAGVAAGRAVAFGLPPLLSWVTPLGRAYPIEPTDLRPGADKRVLGLEAVLRSDTHT